VVISEISSGVDKLGPLVTQVFGQRSYIYQVAPLAPLNENWQYLFDDFKIYSSATQLTKNWVTVHGNGRWYCHPQVMMRMIDSRSAGYAKEHFLRHAPDAHEGGAYLSSRQIKGNAFRVYLTANGRLFWDPFLKGDSSMALFIDNNPRGPRVLQGSTNCRVRELMDGIVCMIKSDNLKRMILLSDLLRTLMDDSFSLSADPQQILAELHDQEMIACFKIIENTSYSKNQWSKSSMKRNPNNRAVSETSVMEKYQSNVTFILPKAQYYI